MLFPHLYFNDAWPVSKSLPPGSLFASLRGGAGAPLLLCGTHAILPWHRYSTGYRVLQPVTPGLLQGRPGASSWEMVPHEWKEGLGLGSFRETVNEALHLFITVYT